MKHTVAYNLTELIKDVYVPSAYIVALDAEQSLTFVQKKATVETAAAYKLSLSAQEKNLFDIITRLSPKALEIKYNGTAKKSTPLSILLADMAVSGKIVDYINRYLGEFLQIVVQEQLPICLNIESKAVAHMTQLDTTDTVLQPIISFEKQADGLLYRLQLSENGRVSKVQDKHCILVCNEPAWVVREGVLQAVADINSAKLKPFFTKDTLVVPKNNLKTYYQKIILPLVEKIDFEHKGFDILPYHTILKAELAIVDNFITHSSGLQLTFDYGKMSFKWKETRLQKSFLDIGQQESVTIHHVKRDTEKEKKHVETLQNFGLTNVQATYFEPLELPQPKTAALIEWLATHHKELTDAGFTVKTPMIGDKIIALLRPSLSFMTATQQNDWFDLKGEVLVGKHVFPFAHLIPYIRNQNPYFPLPDGTYFLIPDEWFERFQGIAQMGKTHNNNVRIARSQAPAILPTDFFSIEEEKTDIQNVVWTPPQYLKANLRPYQIEGVEWLLRHYHANLGACLADDMGLGKTLQTIAALLYAKEHRSPVQKVDYQMDIFSSAPQQDFLQPLQALIILPASLVYNWESEWRKFAPTVHLYLHIGAKRHKDIRLIQRNDVVITTYQTVTKDIEWLEKIEWEYVVLDESQYIKNKSSDTFKAVNRLNAAHKISLSGTPIENSLSDLWAQMQFINPNLLNSYAHFDQHFIKPIERGQDEGQKERLRDLVKPYLLRRTKQEVAKDLPEVVRQIVYSDMDSEQKKVYEKEKSAVRNLLLGGESVGKSLFEYRAIVIQSITKLRQLAIHPRLVLEGYKGESAKFNDALAKWEEVQRAGHKMLIFSTFVENLKMYRTHFDKNKQPYTWLTGDTSLKERQQEILDFGKKEAIQTFLISLKAGGAGLNLTAADYVFLLDPWWNPSVEEQAIARAHRIGQTRTVMALKFITRDTIEEKILQLQERKKQLVADILDFESTPNFSREDLAFLLG
ncbi:MAG: DEAD/DEAH box helicase [Saprospiraceae bacterium]|nr:DEAD/DEAH box helicase [Saprospiraceae bacterium]